MEHVSQEASASVSAISWPAILGGAVVAAAVSIILVFLGTGIGLASASPWSHAAVGPTTFAVGTAIWFVVLQWIPSGIGGFITGRLRTRWMSLHTHEVFFRDTAHGLITWGIATLIAAVVITSVASTGVKRTTDLAHVTSEASQRTTGSEVEPAAYPQARYDVDLLFRSNHADGGVSLNDAVSLSDSRAEAGRILAKEFVDGGLSPADRQYLAVLISKRGGISDAIAQERVEDVASRVSTASIKAKEEVDKGRKVAAATSLFTALSLFVGAFIACVAGALGGSLRDEHI